MTMIVLLNHCCQKEFFVMKVTDPVCGMKIDPKNAAASADYKGEKYYFCDNSCKVKFKKDPGKFTKK